MAFYPVPRRTDLGDRLTYAVNAYRHHQLPGWKTVRILGGFYQLPPGAVAYWTDSDIKRFILNATPKQKNSFETSCRCRPWSFKTKDISFPALYSIGRRYFHNCPEETDLSVTPIRGTYHDMMFTGIKVSCVYGGVPQQYCLIASGDLTMRTFYKYLMFYGERINHVPVDLTGAPALQMKYRKLRSYRCFIESCELLPAQSVL